ncbi:unnamed protein product [Amoebophrya sp. A25]|nr:unnamed protein product [Amoebophrya sp. A25]|eukprot:GSA25T00020857001.1
MPSPKKTLFAEGVPALECPIPVGATVSIYGIQKLPLLNGRTGIVTKGADEKGRFTVELLVAEKPIPSAVPPTEEERSTVEPDEANYEHDETTSASSPSASSSADSNKLKVKSSLNNYKAKLNRSRGDEDFLGVEGGVPDESCETNSLGSSVVGPGSIGLCFDETQGEDVFLGQPVDLGLSDIFAAAKNKGKKAANSHSKSIKHDNDDRERTTSATTSAASEKPVPPRPASQKTAPEKSSPAALPAPPATGQMFSLKGQNLRLVGLPPSATRKAESNTAEAQSVLKRLQSLKTALGEK